MQVLRYRFEALQPVEGQVLTSCIGELILPTLDFILQAFCITPRGCDLRLHLLARDNIRIGHD